MTDKSTPSTLNRRSVANPDCRFDLKDPSLHIRPDLDEIYRTLRLEAPVHWIPEVAGPGFWACLGYAVSAEVLKRPDVFSADFRLGGMRMFDAQSVSASPRPFLLSMDPPEHGKLRRRLLDLFKPKVVGAALPRMRDRANRLVGAVAERGEADFVSEIAAPLSNYLLTDFLEVPHDQGRQLAKWANIMMGDDDPDLQLDPAARHVQMQEFDRYFLTLLGRDVERASDTVLKRISEAEFEGCPFDTESILTNAAAFMIAASETTRHAMAGMMVAFTEFRQEWNKLLDDRGMVPAAAKEIVRWTSPLKHVRRTAKTDYDLAGVQVRKGDKIVVWYDAANRDAMAWPDADKFCVDRYQREGCALHLGFGTGVHHCLGWRFAEAEIAALLNVLLDTLPDIRVTAGADMIRSNFVRGYKRLPVRFARRPGFSGSSASEGKPVGPNISQA
jgi:linalool 8-monooxygenase